MLTLDLPYQVEAEVSEYEVTRCSEVELQMLQGGQPLLNDL
jgi:hypothetical protein